MYRGMGGKHGTRSTATTGAKSTLAVVENFRKRSHNHTRNVFYNSSFFSTGREAVRRGIKWGQTGGPVVQTQETARALTCAQRLGLFAQQLGFRLSSLHRAFFGHPESTERPLRTPSEHREEGMGDVSVSVWVGRCVEHTTISTISASDVHRFTLGIYLPDVKASIFNV